MTTIERVAYALKIAKEGNFAEARNILLLANADERAWAKFGKLWRGE